LLIKLCPATEVVDEAGKPLIDTQWRWVLPAAVSAHNASIQSSLARDQIGYSPDEILFGMGRAIHKEMEEQATTESIRHAVRTDKRFLLAVAFSRVRMLKEIRGSQVLYLEQLTKLRRNAFRPERQFTPGDIVRHGVYLRSKREAKARESMSEKMVVVHDLKRGRFGIQKMGDINASVKVCSADNMRSDSGNDSSAKEAATKQARDARSKNAEYTVEAISTSVEIRLKAPRSTR
jgi:hypothetical protein